MRKLGALCVLAGLLTQGAAAQDVKPTTDTQQIIVDPKTLGASKAIDQLVKDFGAKVVKDVGPHDAKVISLPSDKATEFVQQMRGKIKPGVADYQLLKGNYTSFLQPPPTVELTEAQKGKVEKLSRVGPTYVVAAPPRNFSKFVLSEGLGKSDGLKDEKSLVINFSNENLIAINGRHIRKADGTIQWSAKLKYHQGLVTLIEDAAGLSGVIRKGPDVFIVQPLADEFGKRLQTITKIEKRRDIPTHDPKDAPIPMGKKSQLDDEAIFQRQGQESISVLFVYTDKSRAVVEELGYDPKRYSDYLLAELNALTEESARVRILLPYLSQTAKHADTRGRLERRGVLR
jgi:hypothetical protein